MNFNPRAPCGARRHLRELAAGEFDISIHAPRAGRDQLHHQRPGFLSISIHAPRAGRDEHPHRGAPAENYFNPRAPCGARRVKGYSHAELLTFQSTRPVRGATLNEKHPNKN